MPTFFVDICFAVPRLERDRVPVRGDERGGGARGRQGLQLRQPHRVQLRPLQPGGEHARGLEVGRLQVSAPLLQMVLFIMYLYVYDEDRQVTKPTFPLQSCRSRTGFGHSRSRYRTVARGCNK